MGVCLLFRRSHPGPAVLPRTRVQSQVSRWLLIDPIMPRLQCLWKILGSAITHHDRCTKPQRSGVALRPLCPSEAHADSTVTAPTDVAPTQSTALFHPTGATAQRPPRCATHGWRESQAPHGEHASCYLQDDRKTNKIAGDGDDDGDRVGACRFKTRRV